MNCESCSGFSTIRTDNKEFFLLIIEEEIHTTGQINNLVGNNANYIYGFFLGDKEGMIHKEQIFNVENCPLDILTNLVKAICSFAEETKISDYGTIELSKSNISFHKIQDITYVLSHGILEREEANSVMKALATEFEKRSRAKFHSDDPAQVFSGASAVFNQTVEDLFSSILEKPLEEPQEEPKKKQYAPLDMEIDLVGVPISFDDLLLVPKHSEKKIDSEVKTKQKKKEPEISEPLSKDQKLSAVSFNILNSISGIDHLVYVEHDEKSTNLFFQSGNLSDDFVTKTLKICEKFLDNILNIMKDESMENSIEVTEKYQIIFVELNESNFMYAIAKRSVDSALMNPVFERIAKRIKDVVLEYKES